MSLIGKHVPNKQTGNSFKKKNEHTGTSIWDTRVVNSIIKCKMLMVRTKPSITN